MSAFRFRMLAALAMAVATAAVAVPAGQAVPAVPAATGGHAPWMAQSLAPEGRARALVARMTLDEKIAMVHGSGYPTPFNAAGYAGVIPANSRLGIPAVYLVDSPVGVGNGSTGVTQWADTSALASTWDTSLAHAFGSAYGAEQFGKGHNVALAPTVNILRLPLWGRAPETYSEDPYLTAQQSTATIRGIQSQHVVATVKHFIANNQEVLRSSINAEVPQRALRELYEPAFHAAVTQGHVGAVMCSYNQVNGDYACENAEELTNVLRDAWHFDGMVMSDWGSLHHTVKAAKAGLDLEMPGAKGDNHLSDIDKLFGSYFNSKLKAAVQNGSVSRATLDTMITHILTAMFRIGLFDHPAPDPAAVRDAVVSTPQHLALSTKIAEDGTVLLKNARSVLPLRAGRLRSIAVIGDAADQHPVTAAGGSAYVLPSKPVVSPLAGITARAGSHVTVSHAQGTLGVAALPAVSASAFPGGVTATYYASADLSGTPLATETVSNLDVTGKPSAVGSHDVWSVRYTGTINAPAAGTYRFSLSAGGYVRVYIDGKLVVGYTPAREPVRNGLIHLTAGRHSIRVDETPFLANLVTVDLFVVTPGLHLGWQPRENLLVQQAAVAAKRADVAVVVASDPTSEGWDRSTLALPADQDQLISAVAKANRRTIVVLNTASAVTMPWLNKVAGALEVWIPGQTFGTALARVLFGDANPSGKLPVTFPRNEAQGPARTPVEYPGDGTDVFYDEGLLVGYRWYDAKRQRPLFPFGYGLSYTSFRLSSMQVEPRPGGWVANVTVTNSGRRTGSDTAQLYLRSPAAAQEPPQQLKAYTKVTLRAGESRRVNLPIPRDALASWDNVDTGWTVHPGTYRLYVGDSSRNLPLSVQIHVR